ncbi:hypothetical protein [Frankia nepalensis]|nr:hypothetical protein [Frankia nepalensis]MBL7495117.1 hypothetical protein [Frankia nepalensis]
MAGQWPIEERALDDLDLDLRNVRIPGGDLDEAAIINYLVEAAGLLELARSILRDGYIDNELPVVVDEGGRCVVLEGNRRVAALKAIHRPSLLGMAAPKIERHISRHRDADTPTEIRVMIVPSREAAQPLLARLHTRNPKKEWIREQKAIFYHAQLAQGMTVDALRARYPDEQGSTITSYIRMGEIRDVVRGLRFDDPDLARWVMNGQLKITSLEYAYERPKIQEALGLAFDKDGLLASKQMSEGQTQALIYLLRRFRARTLDTRSHELIAKYDAHTNFAEELRLIVIGAKGGATPTSGPNAGSTAGGGGAPSGQPGAGGSPVSGTAPGASGHPVPGTSSGGAAASGDGRGAGSATTVGGATGSTGGTGGSGAAPGSQPGARGPNRGDTHTKLNMDGFVYKGSSAGLRRRFEELRSLSVKEFPNAAHDLLRTVLECSIKDYFAASAQATAAQTTPAQPSKKPRMLKDCIDELAAAYQNDARMRNLINMIKHGGSTTATKYVGTAVSLNASNHEPDIVFDAKDVHEAWDKIKPILVEIVGK